MSEQQPQPAPPPEQAPSLGELLEATMTAVPYPGVFLKMAERAAPGYFPMLVNLLAFWGLALGIRVVRELAAGTPGFDPVLLLAPALLALFAVACFSLPGALVVHALSLLSGGQAEFKRSYQLVSLISSVAVIDALLSFAPGLWFVRSLIAAWLLAEGSMALHKAQPPRARAVFSFLAAVGIAAQWQAQKLAERAVERQAAAVLQQSMQQLTPLLPAAQDGRPADQPSTSLGLLTQPAEMPLPTGGPGSINPELLRGLQLPPADGPGSATPAPADPRLQAMQQQTLGMLAALRPMLDNLQAGMSAEDKKRLNGLLTILEQQQKALASGKPQSSAEQKKTMELMMKLQSELMQKMAAPPAPPAKKKGKSR